MDSGQSCTFYFQFYSSSLFILPENSINLESGDWDAYVLLGMGICDGLESISTWNDDCGTRKPDQYLLGERFGGNNKATTRRREREENRRIGE